MILYHTPNKTLTNLKCKVEIYHLMRQGTVRAVPNPNDIVVRLNLGADNKVYAMLTIIYSTNLQEHVPKYPEYCYQTY